MPEVEKDTSPERPSRKKKMRLSPPNIDRYLQMKWGLALLGKERSAEYLEWLREKTGRKAQQ
jgi:hypothetical protein